MTDSRASEMMQGNLGFYLTPDEVMAVAELLRNALEPFDASKHVEAHRVLTLFDQAIMYVEKGAPGPS